MDLSDDLPPPRRPLFFPVVIATVLLSVIGMSAGLVFGTRHQNQRNPTQPVTTPADTPVSDAEPCPPETQVMGQRAGATGTVRIALKVRTRSSVVWICRDDAGALYYHANRGGESAQWIENKTALFLPNVQPDGDGYQVTAHDGTSFSITPSRLRIEHKDGKVEIQDAAG